MHATEDLPPDLCRYLADLRCDQTAVNGPDWTVDWDDGPWPITVHVGGDRRPPTALADVPLGAALDRVLAGTFAVSRIRFDPRGGLPATPDNPFPAHRGPRLVARRPIPSGGGMYPTEAYLLLAGGPSAGAYHYDPYRHELLDLRQPAPAAVLRAAFGLPPGADLPIAALVLTNRYWKNFYKYGEFAARLGAVDVGVALGRVLRLASVEFDVVDPRTDFADDVLNDGLGLIEPDEGAYAVVGLGAARPCPPDDPAGTTRPRPPSVLERSARIKRSARFDALRVAARAEPPSTGIPFATKPFEPSEPIAPPVTEPVGPAVDLPPAAAVHPGGALTRRTSNGRLFTGAPATGAALATVLRHTATSVLVSCGRLIGLCCAVRRVDGVPAGWYRYLPDTGRLVDVGGVSAPAPGRELQEALFADTVNTELAAFTVHVTGADDPRHARAYREQQLVVGVAVEALTLLAEAVGLGCHPVLGYDAPRIDRAYHLAGTGLGTQAQVCFGPVRTDLNWEIAVMSR